MESTVMKVYVDAEGAVLHSCPNCNKMRQEQAKLYQGVRPPVKIQCNCGNVYDIEVEFRKFYRKGTTLDGIYVNASNSSIWGKMTLKNISLQGCGFETQKKNLLKPDEEIKIEFHLNNAQNSLIKKRAVVRSVDNNYVGCQFKEIPGSLDPELGFYLRSN